MLDNPSHIVTSCRYDLEMASFSLPRKGWHVEEKGDFDFWQKKCKYRWVIDGCYLCKYLLMGKQCGT